MHVTVPVGPIPDLKQRLRNMKDTKRSKGRAFARGCIHDIHLKTKIVDLLSASIPSINRSTFASYIFSEVGKDRRVYTWAIHTPDREQDVLAALVFRKHPNVSLIELMWIATDLNYRGEGYGTDLLQYLLHDWYESGNSDYVITHADISAVPFFSRFRFEDSVPFPRDLYDPWIDKYSQSRLLCLKLRRPLGSVSRISGFQSVQILVRMDNVERYPSQVWADGIILAKLNDNDILVQYPFMLRMYEEILSVDSRRLRLGFSSVWL